MERGSAGVGTITNTRWIMVKFSKEWISFDIQGEAHQQQDEAAEDEKNETVEGKPLGARDALAEEAAVVVQVLHARFAVPAVIHLDSLPAALVAELDYTGLVWLHVLLANDAGVHEYGQQAECCDEDEDEDVEVDHHSFEVLVLGAPSRAEGHDDDEQEDDVDEGETGQGGMVGVVN